MGYVAKVGDIVKSRDHHYQIIREINKGCFADAYKARREDGTMIFLKQYKSPTKLVPWFNEYFKYESELNKRLREDPVLKTASIYANEMFLARVYKSDGYHFWTRNECIFQAFPFVTGNTHLGDMIEKGTAAFDWEKKVYACAVFAFALRRLHDVDIVHCDLKPENVQVKLDSTIAIKYRPLLIDMDWSILSDQKAPWHGKQGYVGTPGYTSPEHLRDEAPLEASDVFTAAIIMFQVLAGRHPFASVLDSDDLNKCILEGKHDFRDPSKLKFEGEVTENLKNLLLSALDPNPKKRPTMESIHMELMGMCKELGKPKTSGHAKLPSKVDPTPAMKTPSPKRLSRKKALSPHDASGIDSGKGYTGKTLTIIGDIGKFSTKTGFVLDQGILRRVSSMAKFADNVKQFELAVRGSNWRINSNDSAPNYTCLNEDILSSKFVEVKDGDVICLKGKSSGKKAMELKIKIS